MKKYHFKILRAGARDDTASVAVEFGMIIAPFALITMGLIQSCYNYYVSQLFDNYIKNIGENIRLGIVQTDGSTTNAAGFKTSYVCGPQKPSSLNCNNILVNVQKLTVAPASVSALLQNVSGTGYYTLPAPALSDTAQFCPGAASDFVFVQAVYGSTNFAGLLDTFFSSQVGSAKGFLAATTMLFRNEPFTGSSFVPSGC